MKFKKKFPKMQVSKNGINLSLYAGEAKCEYEFKVEGSEKVTPFTKHDFAIDYKIR
jgi:hypothetical protein